ncbi:MAG TPA: helix-turn-helix domain-containing protein [Streptosporangiaceae bacterium]
MADRDFGSRVASIAALGEPVRRDLYRYVIAQPEPVSREQAAAALGVARHVAKFNLDKLEEEGLLEVEYARPSGRRGPGAGRPAKLYRRSRQEVEVSLPERCYDLVARVMAEAITIAEQKSVPIGAALREAASEAGRELGAEARRMSGEQPEPGGAAALAAVEEVLAGTGYEPRQAGGGLELANCPFHSLARRYTSLVCGINVHLIDSLLNAAGAADVRARLEPSAGRCCVTITGA